MCFCLSGIRGAPSGKQAVFQATLFGTEITLMCGDKAQSGRRWAVGCVCWVLMGNLSLVLPPPLNRGDLRQAAQSLFLILQMGATPALGDISKIARVPVLWKGMQT